MSTIEITSGDYSCIFLSKGDGADMYLWIEVDTLYNIYINIKKIVA